MAEAESAIETCEQQVQRLGWLSADPALARDGEQMRAIELERRGHQERLATLYGEWEGLGAQIEALEAMDA